MYLYTITDLTKIYGVGGASVTALNGISLQIPRGKFVVILGASGSGKSTLLNLLACMDQATAGKILFEDTDITAYNKTQMTKFRQAHIGFVFQSYNLLPDLTALENVEFSTEISGLPSNQAAKALELVGLGERQSHFPAELSGGEQQRVSIARAIAKNPGVLLCDEPTGALDYETGIRVLEVLRNIHKTQGTTVLLITHNQEIAKIADLVITLRSGEIAGCEEIQTPLQPSEVVW